MEARIVAIETLRSALMTDGFTVWNIRENTPAYQNGLRLGVTLLSGPWTEITQKMKDETHQRAVSVKNVHERIAGEHGLTASGYQEVVTGPAVVLCIGFRN